jgi:hypothetical protein
MSLNLVVSPALPIIPSITEDAVRMVRHGLADVLAWLGEDVGPGPGQATHAVMAGDTLLVSKEMHERIRHDTSATSVAFSPKS